MAYPEKTKKSDYITESIRTDITEENCVGAFRDEYGVIYSSDGKELIEGNINLKAYSVRPGTLAISDYAFETCKSLVSVHIPDTVASIGYAAFRDCGSLASIHLPDTVTSIGEYAFAGCTALAGIRIPDTVNFIGNSAFHICNAGLPCHLS